MASRGEAPLAPPINSLTHLPGIGPNPANDAITPARPTSSNEPSSSGNTLAGEDEKHHPAGEKSGVKRSANSSMDHITDLGSGPGVSVRGGKEQFAALERRFSNLSQRSDDLQRQTTRRSVLSAFNKTGRVASNTLSAPDVEPNENEKTEDDFDLAGTLRTGRQRSDAAGIKHKSVGVVWDGLEVIGAGGLKINIRAFPNAITEQFLMPVLSVLGLFGYKPFESKPRTILYPNSGLLRPGEMCLVLGRPGSGCSTFLKAITNQRDSFVSVNGDVQYAGVGWQEMAKNYAG